jgi:hypothetical protein
LPGVDRKQAEALLAILLIFMVQLPSSKLMAAGKMTELKILFFNRGDLLITGLLITNMDINLKDYKRLQIMVY